MMWGAAGSGSVASLGQLGSVVASSSVHGAMFVLRGEPSGKF